MPLLDTGNARGGGAALAADKSSFAASIAAGAAIAQLSNPFGTGTTYAVVGTAPGQLALSGSGIVAGLTAPAGGSTYAIKIRATSADGKREIAETLSFTAQAGTPNATVDASASVRARLANTTTNVGAGINVQVQRVMDIGNADIANPSIELWNGWVNVSAASPASPEVGTGNAISYRACLLTNLNGTDKNQSTATRTILTFANAGACTAGFIWKLDGTTPTAADFAAAGGAITSDNRQITVPSGWRVRSDKAAGLTIAKRSAYMWQLEDSSNAGDKRAVGAWTRASKGEYYKLGSTQGQYVYTQDWSPLTSLTSGTQVSTPVAIWGDAAVGTKTVVVAGDSIGCELQDAAYGSTAIAGDADGAAAFLRRALNAAQLPAVCTAISGDKASAFYASIAAGNGGHAQRELSMRFASAVISEMGHNDRGLPWSGGAAPAYFQPLYRWYWSRLRSACLGGAGRIVQSDFMPKTSSTDSWATSANQTNSVSGSTQYSNLNPLIQGGTFDVASGDPDAGFSANTALYTWASANGLDVDATPHRKWPGTGTASPGATTFDGTHPHGPAHAGIAAILAPQLSTLLGS